MTIIAMPDTPRPPDPEVPAKPTRRRFDLAYKLRVLEEADACTEPGQLAALLRREGLYSSVFYEWKQARDGGRLGTTKRGRPAKPPETLEYERLKRENEKLKTQLHKANLVIDVQKKLSLILGIEQPTEAEILARHERRS